MTHSLLLSYVARRYKALALRQLALEAAAQ
jgi:hypothetical protein